MHRGSRHDLNLTNVEAGSAQVETQCCELREFGPQTRGVPTGAGRHPIERESQRADFSVRKRLGAKDRNCVVAQLAQDFPNEVAINDGVSRVHQDRHDLAKVSEQPLHFLLLGAAMLPRVPFVRHNVVDRDE